MRELAYIGLPMLMLIAGCGTTPPRERDISELSGVEMYEQLCSSCHGVSGGGDGPVAPLIAVGVPDLTRSAYRNGGGLPSEAVRRPIHRPWDRRAQRARD